MMKMLELIKKTKKKTIYLVVGLLLIFGGIAYIIIGNNGGDEPKTSKIQKVEKAEKAKKTAKAIKEDKKDAKAELEKAKKSGDKEEIAKAEKKLESIEKKEAKVVSNGGNSSNGGSTAKSSNTGSTGNSGNAVKPSVKPSTPSTPSTPKPKEKQRVWIVDKAAWTETVTKYRNEQVTKYTCGGKIFDDYESGYEYLIWCTDNGIECGNLGPTTVTVQVPYTETINHPEQGHWEYR